MAVEGNAPAEAVFGSVDEEASCSEPQESIDARDRGPDQNQHRVVVHNLPKYFGYKVRILAPALLLFLNVVSTATEDMVYQDWPESHEDKTNYGKRQERNGSVLLSELSVGGTLFISHYIHFYVDYSSSEEKDEAIRIIATNTFSGSVLSVKVRYHQMYVEEPE